MSDIKKLIRVKELVDNAESALKVAKQILADTMGLNDGDSVDDIIKAIRRGLTTPVGKGIPLTLRIKRAWRFVL